MCMMATLMKRHPAKVAPIDTRTGFFLKFFDLIGNVPKNSTMKKNKTIKNTLSIVSNSSCDISNRLLIILEIC